MRFALAFVPRPANVKRSISDAFNKERKNRERRTSVRSPRSSVYQGSRCARRSDDSSSRGRGSWKIGQSFACHITPRCAECIIIAGLSPTILENRNHSRERECCARPLSSYCHGSSYCRRCSFIQVRRDRCCTPLAYKLPVFSGKLTDFSRKLYTLRRTAFEWAYIIIK